MIGVLLMVISTYAVTLTPAAAVTKTFNTKFPKATNVKWSKEKPTEWEAEFTFNGEKVSANFAVIDGAWLETEEAIKVSTLPKAVTDAITAKFKNWVITGADKTESAKDGSIYEADLAMGKLKKDVAFKADGTMVKE